MAYTRITTDTLSNPITATVGTPITGNLGTTTPKNIADYYRFNITNAGTLDINLTTTAVTAGSAGVRYTLYYGTSTGTYLFSNLTTSTSVHLSAGTYTLYVATQSAYTRNTDYQINLGQTEIVDEAGNSTSSANISTIGSISYTASDSTSKTISGKVGGYNLAVGVIDPADYYQMSLAESSNITLTNTNLPSPLTATIVNSNGVALSSLNKIPAGDYYLYINGLSSRTNSLQDYSINLTATKYVDLTASLSYDSSEFTESTTNNSSISNTITATLTNDTFTGAVNSALAITGTNVPAGLTLTATKLSDTTAKIALSGLTTASSSSNNISNLGFSFGNSAFTKGNASLVTNATKSGISVAFRDSAVPIGNLTYNISSISESTANNGSLTNFSVTLSGDTFTGSNNATLPITVSNLPAGLTATATKLSDTTALISFSGNATLHQQSNSITNFSVAFGDSAFTSGNANLISNSIKVMPINFTNNTRSLAFDKTTLSEISANNGAIDSFITVTLSGDMFSGSIDSTLPMTVSNLPAGLTATAIRLSDTTAKIYFTGSATNHASTNSVSNLKLVFNDDAFSQKNANLVTNNSTTQNFGLTFIDATTPSVTLNTYTSSTNVSVASDIVLNFSDNIVANSSGEIIITDGTNRTVVPITDTKQIKIEGSKLTINPTSDLVANKNYHVEMASNVIVGFAGISDPNTVKFTTGNIIYAQGIKGNTNSTGSGTITSPYQSIGYASTKALTGDTIYVLDNANVISSNYTLAGSGYTIKPASNHTGKYQFSTMTAFTVTGTNITIENFEFTGNSNALNYWDLLANYVWTPANLPAVGSIALNVSTGQDITIRDNYFHDLQQKAVNIESGRYVTVSDNIIHDVATTSLSGGHAIMRQQGTGVFGTADDSSKYRWDISNNIFYNVEQRIYSWVPSKGYLNMTLDEGKPINIDETTDLEMKARISNNVILNPAIDAIRIKPTANLEVSNNSIYSEKHEADGITDINTLKTLAPYSTNPFPNLVVKNNAVQVYGGKYAFELNDAYTSDTSNFSNNLANGLTNPDTLTGKTTTNSNLFVDPKNGNFNLNQGFSNTFGVSPTVLKNITTSLTNRELSVVADSWTPDHKKMMQTLLDNVPGIDDGVSGNETVFTDRGTYGLSDKESTTGRNSYYFTVNSTWKTANNVSNNVLSHSGNFSAYNGKYEIVTPSDYSDSYNYYKIIYSNYSSLRWGSSYIAQNKVFDANGIFIAEVKNNTDFTQTTATSGKTITLDGDFAVNLDSYSATGTNSFDLITASSIIGTFDNVKTLFASNNVSYKIAYDSSKVTLTLSDSNAILSGTDSADILAGNHIDGKLGNDTLSGGNTANTFVFSTTPNSTTNSDTITNFKTTDRINLSLTSFASLGGTAGSTLSSNRYSDSTTITTDTRIYADRSVSGQVNLYYDSDGSGSAVATKFATLSNFSSALTASNFGIIA